MKRAAYWAGKRARNARRDRRTAAQLRRAGWGVLVVWECHTKDIAKLTRRIAKFLAR